MTQMSMTEFEEKLVQLFNNVSLPFEAKRYVVLSFFRTVEDLYIQQKQNIKQVKPESEEGSEPNV